MSDPRIEEASRLILNGGILGTLHARELMVVVLAVAERAGVAVPEGEGSNAGDENARSLAEEADALLDMLLISLTDHTR